MFLVIELLMDHAREDVVEVEVVAEVCGDMDLMDSIMVVLITEDLMEVLIMVLMEASVLLTEVLACGECSKTS